MKRTSLLLVFLSVAFALTGCNKKPAAPAEQQPVAEQQRASQSKLPSKPRGAATLRPPASSGPATASSRSAAGSRSLALASRRFAPGSRRVAPHPQASTPRLSKLQRRRKPPNAKQCRVYPDARTPGICQNHLEDPLAARVGLFIPLTGSQASFGIDALNGAKLAVDEINEQGGVLDHPVNLIVKDTESRTEQVASVVGELIDTEKVVALIGEITTDRTLAAAPLAQERGIPLITPSATNEKITAVGNYVFRACYTDAFQAAMMTKFARSLDVEKVAMLFDGNNPYGTSLSNAFKVDFVKQGGSIVAEQTYRAGDVDYATQLNAIKLKNPDIVFLPSYFAEAAVIIKQARQLGHRSPIPRNGWVGFQRASQIRGTSREQLLFRKPFFQRASLR